MLKQDKKWSGCDVIATKLFCSCSESNVWIYLPGRPHRSDEQVDTFTNFVPSQSGCADINHVDITIKILEFGGQNYNLFCIKVLNLETDIGPTLLHYEDLLTCFTSLLRQ